MRIYSLATTLLAPVLLIFLLAPGCSEPSTSVIDDNDSGPPATDDVGEEDIADADATDDEEFEKPPVPSSSERGERNFYTGDDTEDMTPYRWIWGRDHMHWTNHLLESWLYPGEYFVRDGHFTSLTTTTDEKRFEIFVLSDGEYLPLRIVHVTDDGGFPTMDEIESWDEELFVHRETIDHHNLEPFNYTLVVPPWAFPQKGAHNLQVIVVPVWEPTSDTAAFHRHVSARYSVNRTHTIYYGSKNFHSDGQQFRDRQNEGRKTVHKNATRIALISNGLFLAPPLDVYDWTTMEYYEVDDEAKLAEILEVSDPVVTLDLHIAGLDDALGTAGKNLYYVKQDDEIIDVFWFEADEIEHTWPGDYEGILDVMPVEIAVPADEESTVQVFSVPDVYDPRTEVYYEDHDYPTKVAESNALVLRYEPNKDKEVDE